MYEEPKMEKLTINLPPVEIGRIDIIIEAGLYPSRTEFIRTAVRKALDTHKDFIDSRLDEFRKEYDEKEKLGEKDEYAMKFFGMGVIKIGKKSFERALKQGKKINFQAIGLVYLDDDITPEMILKTVEKIKVYGILRASPKVKAALEKIEKDKEIEF